MTVDHISGARDVDPEFDPELANALGALAMNSDKDDEPNHLIASPPDGTVTLPGGYATATTLVRTATVRELNGEDEEEIARPSIANDLNKFIDAVLHRCVLSVGNEPATPAMLDSLLIGDREMLLQGIRVATFGDNIRLDVTCPDCSEKFKVDYSFSHDVPITQLDGHEVELDDGVKVRLAGGEHTYNIPLRKGRVAQVRLVDGSAQKAVYVKENQNRTPAELNTMLLRQCVELLDGSPVVMDDLRKMSTGDRVRILTFLNDAQPGPQYQEVTQACPACERDLPLVIDVPTMFRGF